MGYESRYTYNFGTVRIGCAVSPDRRFVVTKGMEFICLQIECSWSPRRVCASSRSVFRLAPCPCIRFSLQFASVEGTAGVFHECPELLAECDSGLTE
jgi:hypothetical protein